MGFAILAAPVCAQFSPGPLSRAHRRFSGLTQCTACHTVAGEARGFKCLNCHTEIRQRLANSRGYHATLLGKNRSSDQCAKCHSEHNGEDFVPIRWTEERSELDHGKTGYVLEGAHRGLACEKCHTPEHISPAERKTIRMADLRRTYLGLSRQCASCHDDAHAGQLGTDCARCHTVTKWKDVSGFDHSTARFKLAGAHQRVACAKCHRNTGELRGGKARIQFAGLEFQQCSDCHKDPHLGAFAARCETCHSESAWKPVRMAAASFDHGRTDFPLLGRHAGLACEKCHSGANFKQTIAHQKCADCHRDQHNAQFAGRTDRGECGSCHTVEGWKPATFTVERHRESGYALEGRHSAVECARCHAGKGTATVYRVRRERCDNCHQDAHGSQFASAPYGNRCESCHSTDGFRPSRFTLADHAKTRFPLPGAHKAVACVECHNSRAAAYPPPPARFRFADLSCTGCHPDPHSGQFQTSAGCESCHTTETWRDTSKFDHDSTRFPLLGAHRGVTCEQCHRATAIAAGTRGAVFQGAPRQCSACHEDVHGGQFSTAAGHAECGGCHNLDKWRPSKFDHNKTSFALDGAHREVACGQCHRTRREVNGRVVLFYKPAPKDCAACHGPGTS